MRLQVPQRTPAAQYPERRDAKTRFPEIVGNWPKVLRNIV
jgi:hypothetical protein